jgi:predicted nucleic acid-binding protein
VKLFKEEPGSDRAIQVMATVDRKMDWAAYSSRWARIEVARALRKDRKPPEIVALDLQELQSHRIQFQPVSDALVAAAEQLVGATNLYAADALHVATYRFLEKTQGLDGFLCDDLHYARLKPHLPALKLDQLDFAAA